MIDQEQQRQNDEIKENIQNNEKEFSKDLQNENVSFKIYTDFISQSALFVQIILCWFLLHLQLSGSIPVKKIGFNFEIFSNVSIDIHTLVWSINIVGFLIVLICVQNQSRKMFLLHFFPFIGVLFFIIIAFYFHIIVLRKVKNILINPLSYIIIGGLAVTGLELLRNKLDNVLFLLGLTIFMLSNLICWIIEWLKVNLRNQRQELIEQQQSSFCGAYCLQILVELIQFFVQICLLVMVIWVFSNLDQRIELIPALIIGFLQQLNYLLFKLSYSKMRMLNKENITILQQTNINNQNRQVSHYVFIYYINLILFFSLLFCIAYYLPQFLHPQKFNNPQPPQPNTTHPIPPPTLPQNNTDPNPSPKNNTPSLPPPKNNTNTPKNNTNPNPKNDTQSLPKNLTYHFPKNITAPITINKNLTASKNDTINLPKNMTKATPVSDKKEQTNNKTEDIISIIKNLILPHKFLINYELNYSQNIIENQQKKEDMKQINYYNQNTYKKKNSLNQQKNKTNLQESNQLLSQEQNYKVILHEHTQKQPQRQKQNNNNTTYKEIKHNKQ